MKRKLIIGLLTVLCLSCVAAVFSSCSKNADKYKLEECTEEIREYNNGDNYIGFGKKYGCSEFTIYFDNALNATQTDSWIDRTYKFSALLNEKQLSVPFTLYVGDGLICNYWTTDEGDKSFSFPSEVAEEQAFAWFLLEQVGNEDLPYGIYAGVASQWLNKTEYSNFSLSEIGEKAYLTELQFPLYEANNLPDEERASSWGFSYLLAKDWLNSGKTEQELLSLNKEQLNAYLQEKYNFKLPEYTFSPYSSKYEYQVKEGCFTYYINKEYNDLIIPKSHFTTSYNFLSDWLKDNIETTKASNEKFGIDAMYPLNVYLLDGLLRSNALSSSYGDTTDIFSVGAFSGGYIYHILFKTGDSGFMDYITTRLNDADSKYTKLMWYYFFSGKSETFPYAESVNEKGTYEETMKLYNKKSSAEASVDNFDYWLFADCYSALYTKEGEAWDNGLQFHSLCNYIASEYGSEYIKKMNTTPASKVIIDGKTYSEVTSEWLGYLKAFAE